MNKTQNTFITSSEFTLFLLSSFIGIGSLYLPNSVIKDAKQDGWIGCIIGAVYPLYILVLANYTCNKFPVDDIFGLSKKSLGKILGSILNFIFITFFIFITSTEIIGLANTFKVYATPFLKNYQIFLSVITVTAYTAYKGMKPLGRLCEITFYLALILLLLPVATLKYGTYLNLMPVFGSGFKNILISSKETVFFYCGAEIAFFTYPFLEDKKKLLKCGFTSTVITMSVYTWFTFLTIYYLGIEISPKYLCPILTLADSINIPIINSFRYIFISLWGLVVLRCISIYYFSSCYGMNRLINKISPQTFALILCPIILFLSSLYGPPTRRRYYTGKIMSFYLIYNLIYISLIVILITFKKGGNFEKK
ncbi:spore germination protein YndE [Clostridium ragsdalei P11]|uniref:Spore germination protein YndE n=1 Tax=Clostridium ragsdalei P11 TaxID=1353534 RepID=A0A1A6B435_9CLOT|nr:GerAB/ArcD/ProY family transporter [Clostridium ragsdalei]OBR97104.1 spore germination protein YndE [Clostridium ragsdalei P11]